MSNSRRRPAQGFYRELAVRSPTAVGAEVVTGTATGALPAVAPAGWTAVTQ